MHGPMLEIQQGTNQDMVPVPWFKEGDRQTLDS